MPKPNKALFGAWTLDSLCLPGTQSLHFCIHPTSLSGAVELGLCAYLVAVCGWMHHSHSPHPIRLSSELRKAQKATHRRAHAHSALGTAFATPAASHQTKPQIPL